jgi:Arc/MetJ family transcription regulator
MARTRINITVDAELLADARRSRAGATDAELIDHALAALLARYRAAEIDAAYAVAYVDHPIDEADEWGDLASFRSAAAAT